jgi:hypothetical protein
LFLRKTPFFAKNCRKSQKIVIITSVKATPDPEDYFSGTSKTGSDLVDRRLSLSETDFGVIAVAAVADFRGPRLFVGVGLVSVSSST